MQIIYKEPDTPQPIESIEQKWGGDSVSTARAWDFEQSFGAAYASIYVGDQDAASGYLYLRAEQIDDVINVLIAARDELRRIRKENL